MAIARARPDWRGVAQREALLAEARADLDRALKIGGPGRYTDQVAAASWDSVIMDLGPERPLHRITTGDARKGTQDLTESLFTLPVEQFVATVGA